MAEYIEIVFEEVNRTAIEKLLVTLNKQARISSIEIAANASFQDIDHYQIRSILQNMQNYEDGSINIRVKDFILLKRTLVLANILILKYQRLSYDVYFLIPENDFLCTELFDTYRWVRKVNKLLKAARYYCGYDPSDYIESQFFSSQSNQLKYPHRSNHYFS